MALEFLKFSIFMGSVFIIVQTVEWVFPQLLYGEREKMPSALAIHVLDESQKNLSFNELKKIFPYNKESSI